jgi:hypothetical protein
MKPNSPARSLACFAVALLLAPLAAPAQSEAASANVSAAATASGTASAQTVAAAAHASVGSFRLVSGIAAVPVWMSGTVSTGAGRVSTQIGKDSVRAGTELWDFATGEPAKRPPLARDIAIPKKETATATAAVAKPRDPSPAEALKGVRPQ